MKLLIKSIENGYILKNEEGVELAFVDETYDFSEHSSKRHVVRLLQAILDELGEAGSRYDAERVFIDLRPGDKYEEK